MSPVRPGFALVVPLAGMLLMGCQSVRPSAAEPIRLSDDILLQPIAAGVWIHTTYFNLPTYGRYPANGLLVIDGKEALLIDLPWTDEQTAALLDWVTQSGGAVVKTVIPTHFHKDCMGGLAEAHRRGAVSYGLDKTIALARQKGLPVPQNPYSAATLLRCGGTTVCVMYPGPGHTTDNVVAWLPKQKILFAGCLVKSLDARSLGNTQDGDLAAYPTTVQKVRTAYPQARIVVPGHGDWGGPELIEHTARLCAGRSPAP
jgi:metallo-beta-lactamase class B